jgi:hypothetical protein
MGNSLSWIKMRIQGKNSRVDETQKQSQKPAPEKKKPFVFISYSHVDDAYLKWVKRPLESPQKCSPRARIGLLG